MILSYNKAKLVDHTKWHNRTKSRWPIPWAMFSFQKFKGKCNTRKKLRLYLVLKNYQEKKRKNIKTVSENLKKKIKRKKIEGNKRWKKLKNKFKINKLFLYNISNFFSLI